MKRIYFKQFILLGIYIIFLNYIGLFNRHVYIGKIEATTGPDFWTVFGRIALKNQIPELPPGIEISYNGIMLNHHIDSVISKSYLGKNNLEYDYYYIIEGKVVGFKHADSNYLHPLIDVTKITPINKIIFWTAHIFFITTIAIASFFSLKEINTKQ